MRERNEPKMHRIAVTRPPARRWHRVVLFCLLLGTASALSAAPASLRVLVPPMPPSQMDELRRVAPNVELVVARSEQEALAKVGDVVGMFDFVSPEVIRAGKRLRWVQVGSAGVENVLFPEMMNSQITLTNAQRVYAPPIADQALAFMVCLSKGLYYFIRHQSEGNWSVPPRLHPKELQGQTVFVLGLGGIGSNLARRANACGMRVLATDPKQMPKPDYVAHLGKPAEFHTLLPEADFVASCVPLTRETQGMIGAREFAMMKRGAFLINMSRGKVVDTNALVEALRSGQLGGAAMDVTDPEPLPKDHPLWQMENVIITPHMSNRSPGSDARRFEVLKENLRRFSRGEPLINVVDKQLGY